MTHSCHISCNILKASKERSEIIWKTKRTNVDGSPNGDYCAYCYRGGAFLADCTMEEMIDFCLEATKDTGLYTDREEARCQMMDWFPTLKRWSK